MSILADFDEKFDSSLIRRFRDFVNANEDFVLNKYGNFNGKNHWSVICSCIDWITVAANYLETFEIKDVNEDAMSMKVYSMISAYDIIVESVIQLHRVFFDNTESPFKDDKTIFRENLTDFKYFKHIKAVFGAHPVNLDNIHSKDNNKKYYASWSTSRLGNNHEMYVYLYSNYPGDRAIQFGIDFYQLHQFALKYYNYLNAISGEIQTQYEAFLAGKRRQEISKVKDIKAEIKILITENQQRTDSDYYGYCLTQLDMMFNAVCTDPDNTEAFNEYLIQLEKVVEEIQINLQNMNLCDLKTEKILNPPKPINKHYDYEKVFNYIFGDNDSYTYHIFSFHFEKIIEDLSKLKPIDSSSTKEELLLFIKTGLYFANKTSQIK